MMWTDKYGQCRFSRGIHRIISICCSCVLISCGMIFMILLGLELAGYSKYVVVSGSMVPVIPVGSCVLVKEEPELSDIKPGEILTFYIDQGKTTVTHRVLENDTSNHFFITGGDANSSPDTAPVIYENCIGTVRSIIPLLGYLLVFLNTIYGKVSLFCLLVLCVWISADKRDTERRSVEA